MYNILLQVVEEVEEEILHLVIELEKQEDQEEVQLGSGGPDLLRISWWKYSTDNSSSRKCWRSRSILHGVRTAGGGGGGGASAGMVDAVSTIASKVQEEMVEQEQIYQDIIRIANSGTYAGGGGGGSFWRSTRTGGWWWMVQVLKVEWNCRNC
jgi:hypothetical protein